MKKNMGGADRTLRELVALVLIALVAFKALAGGWAIAAIAVAVIFLVTSFVNFCPLYTILGINTGKRNKTAA